LTSGSATAVPGGNAVVAAQRQLQPAAHADAVNRGNHGLGRQVQLLDDRDQMRLAVGIFLAELGDIGTARESLAGARDDDGLDGIIRQSLAQPSTTPRRVARPRPLTGGLFKVMTAMAPSTLYSAVMLLSPVQ
jgi:hypothetical protein